MPMTVLLTGSTGNLGSYLLHTLFHDPCVSHIYCLNRTVDAPTRQLASLHQRGLTLPTVSPGFQKITHPTGDLAQPDLSLDEQVLKTIRATPALTILHNAWPVDFNRHFSSFVPQLHALHHLINLALSCTPHAARLVFISSISAAGNWGALPGARASVPESLLDDWKVARLGYGQTKLVAERIIAEAARVSGLEGVVIRVGQVAGPVESGLQGAWPRQEWLPSLVRSSAALGVLPAGLGPLDRVDWVPVDVLARIVGELVGSGGGLGVRDDGVGVTTNGIDSNGTITTVDNQKGSEDKDTQSLLKSQQKEKDKDKKGLLHRLRPKNDIVTSNTRTTSTGSMEYYHIINPYGVSWAFLLPAVRSTLEQSFSCLAPRHLAEPRSVRVVSFAEWVDALERSSELSHTNTKTKSDKIATSGHMLDLNNNPAIKLLPFFKTLQEKAIHLPKARAVVLETKGTVKRSKTLAELRGVSEEWMRLWMRQWEQERAF